MLESNPNLRPKYIQSVESLPQAEKWRSVVIGEISVKLTRIQDPTISDYLIRDLNDSLNKLFNEKRAWEHHIKALGGNDYINFGKNMNVGVVANDGVQVKGYRYYGRARELSEVKKLLKSKAPKKEQPETNWEDRIDLSYYGLYDEAYNRRSGLEKEQVLINEVAERLGETGLSTSTETTENDPLLEYERKVGTQRLMEMKRKYTNVEPEEKIIDFELAAPTDDQVQKWMVETRKKELIAKLRI